MTHLSKGLVLVLAAALLPGCPFESKVPLGEPTRHDVDASLTGYWVWDDPDDKSKSILMTVRPFNDSEYLAILQEEGKSPSQFRAFQVQVGDQVFWNVNEVEMSYPPKTFVFMRCKVTAVGELSLQFVGSKNVPKTLASDATGLTAFLKTRHADPSIYDSDKGLYLWRRPKQGEVEKGLLRRQ